MGAHNFNTTVTDALKAYRSRQRERRERRGKEKESGDGGGGEKRLSPHEKKESKKSLHEEKGLK